MKSAEDGFMPISEADPLDRLLAGAAADTDPSSHAAPNASALLQRLVDRSLDRLPMPGGGRTLDRWRALAAVARHDLSLAKLYEGHTDALAILHELGEAHRVPEGSTWGVWAAESPEGRTRVATDGADPTQATLTGVKCWCSGASTASHALLTAWHADGRGPQLVLLPLRQAGVEVSAASWHAVGMARSASVTVRFDHARGVCIGEVGAYISRPGFWHGGAGIAACWYGGALGIASTLHEAVVQAAPEARSPLRLAALGRVDLAVAGLVTVLRDAARWIDAHPMTDAGTTALRVRLAAERCATEVLGEVGRSLGATPYCRDARFARAAADLPVFIRQSHADRDLAALGERAATSDDGAWKL